VFSLSLSTFRDRWPLFIGAILTVAMGVALVQSSLLILVSAASPHIPAGLPPLDAAQLRDIYEAGIALLGMTLGLSVFLAVFIVSSTFAFTVAQRRRDLALLRLVGGDRRQVRRLLLSEALLLGVIGTALGVPLGLLAMRFQAWLLADLGFLPGGFIPRWQDWILAVSAGVGIGVALIGVLAASRRASKVRPLEALGDVGAATRVMSMPRWLFGCLFLAGSITLMITSRFAPPDGAVPMSIFVAITGSVAFTQFSPLIVPLIGRVAGLVLRGSTLGTLAQANLRDGVRRSASTAAPLLVLVALVVGLSGTLASLAKADKDEQTMSVSGDLIVKTTGANGARVAAVPGVAVAAQQVSVPVTVTIDLVKNGKPQRKVEDGSALAVDADPYLRTHPRSPASGSLADLRGETIALGPGNKDADSTPVGSTVSAEIGGRTHSLKVVAVLPQSMNGGTGFLVPRELVPDSVLAGAASQVVVQVKTGADPAAVTTAISAAGAGRPVTVAQSIAAQSADHDGANSGIFQVLLGLAGVYALVAVVNSVVIAAAGRKAEFAAVRVTGLSRPQVVKMALVEAWAVTAIGLLLGGLAATGALFGIRWATERITGVPETVLPGQLFGFVVFGAFLVVGVTSVWTSLSATRVAPIALIGARE
jgi:putative ABC transport system permease protein